MRYISFVSCCLFRFDYVSFYQLLILIETLLSYTQKAKKKKKSNPTSKRIHYLLFLFVVCFVFFDLQFTCTFLLDIRFTTVTRSDSPGRHRPVMALTRAMAAKLASQSSVVDRDITSSQPKTAPRHRYPLFLLFLLFLLYVIFIVISIVIFQFFSSPYSDDLIQ